MRDSIISGNEAATGYEISQQLQGDGSQSAISVMNSVVGSNQISSYFYAVRSDNNSSTPALNNSNFIGTGDRQDTGIDDIIYTNLDYNGGLTPTHNLPATSPARNFSGSYNCATTDQRNESRGDLTRGTPTCDVGAVEHLPINQTIQVDSGCTLADAINTVNTNAPYGDCEVGGVDDIITFENSNSTITLTEALPEITSDVTIQGNGATVDANGGDFPVIVVNGYSGISLPTSPSSVEISDITLTGGKTFGGFRISYSDAILNHVNITGNTCTETGRSGGIDSINAILDIYNSSISNNTCVEDRGYGGGIYSRTSILNIYDSTISNNVSDSGAGGILAAYSRVILLDSTISGNTSTNTQNNGADTGGLYLRSSSLFMFQNTVSGNSGYSSGGIKSVHSFSARNTTRIGSSIIAGNESTGSSLNASEMSIFERNGSILITESLIGNNAGSNTDSFNDDALAAIMNEQSNLLATSDGLSLPLEEIIAPLGDNGGPTLTHGLVQGSQAIDVVFCPAMAIDQRGEPRDDDWCDIGAFEAQADEVLASPPLTCFVVTAANDNVVTFCL